MSKRIKEEEEEVAVKKEQKRNTEEPDTLGDELIAINDSIIESFEKKVASLLKGKLVPHPLSTSEGCQNVLASMEALLKKEAKTKNLLSTIQLYIPHLSWFNKWKLSCVDISSEGGDSAAIFEANQRLAEFRSKEKRAMLAKFCSEWNKKHPSVRCERTKSDMHLLFNIRK
jgi:hypothetical protein